MLRKYRYLAAALLFAGASLGTASAQEDFYAGKQINLIIGADVGAGFDAYARLLATHMSKFIPGNPRIVPQNMPAAGGLQATNFLYNVAPKDGLTIGALQRTAAQAPLQGQPGADYDASEFNWLGSLASEIGVCVADASSPVQRFEDLFEHELIVPGSAQSDSELHPRIFNNIFGTKFEVITGYAGGAQLRLALEQGEVDGRCGWSWSSLKQQQPDWIEDGRINILVQTGFERDPDLPDVPLAFDFVTSEEQRQILNFHFARQLMGRPYAIPPGVPEDRVQILRDAFDAMIADPEVQADFAAHGELLLPTSGVQVQAMVDDFYAMSPDLLEKAAAAIME